MAGLASGKRFVSASGNATTALSTTSAQGLPSVSYSNGSSIQAPSYQPLTTRTWSPVGIAGLRDEGELRVERQRDMTDQTAKELVADRARGPFGNGAKQVPAAEARVGLVGVDVKRHDPLPGTDATEPRAPPRAAEPARTGTGPRCRR